MKISQEQLMVLWEVFSDTSSMANRLGGFDEKTRNRLLNEIINQQSEELQDFDEEK